MKRYIFTLLSTTLPLVGATTATAQGVILAIGSGVGQPPIRTDYDPSSFGRLVSLGLVYRTGNFELCGSVDPEGVVLELTIQRKGSRFARRHRPRRRRQLSHRRGPPSGLSPTDR